MPDDSNGDQKKVLHLSGASKGKLESKKPVNNQVRNSFSHGRSKPVTIEVKRKRHVTAGDNISMGKNPKRHLTREELEQRLLKLREASIQHDAEQEEMEYAKKKFAISKEMSPKQIIYFGPPGTGKSHGIRNGILKDMMVDDDCIIETMFHPEYGYGEFMGKLMPLTVKEGDSNVKKVSYDFYPGDFLHALGLAYKEIFNPKMRFTRNVVLIIDEINRGNCSSIFGSIFQLLDRGSDGFSSYSIRMTDMEWNSLMELSSLESLRKSDSKQLNSSNDMTLKRAASLIEDRKMSFPPNFSIIATMNTSDESIYYMDSAFKRRWDWEYVSVGERDAAEDLKDVPINNDISLKHGNEWLWIDFVDSVNEYIRSMSSFISKVEDKQIGYRFIRCDISKDGMKSIHMSRIKSKLCFFLWDTVFPRDKSPMVSVLDNELKTLKDMLDAFENFVGYIRQVRNNK